MTTSQFLIGPIKDAVRRDVKPFAILEDAFPVMTNAYTWRSRVTRRLGYKHLGRLCHDIEAGDAGAIGGLNFSANLFAVFGVTPSANIVPGSIRITIAGGGGYVLDDRGTTPGAIVKIGGAGTDFSTGTINYLTSDLSLTFSVNPGTNVIISFCYALNLPVMGLKTRELFAINQQDLIAFDTRFAYRFSNTNNDFELLSSLMPVTWSGTNSDFFFTTNYAGAFWATNSLPGVHGFVVTNFANVVGQSVDVTTAAANNFVIGDRVYFVNVTGAAAPNNLTQGAVTVAGNPFTILIDGATPPTAGAASSGIALTTTNTVTGQDGIRWYASTAGGATWANYAPPINANEALFGALLIFPYRGYLMFLNTTEGDGVNNFNYPQRMRWTQVGTPYYAPPVPNTPYPQTFDIDAARDDLFGRGGALDAPTNDIIIGAGFIRDILVVFFQRSTWRIRFTYNAQDPFVWERVNIELGANSTFSVIPFDKGLMGIGNRGIVISDGNDTQRFDDKIPDEIFEIRNGTDNMGPKRVHGIRTFRTRLNYWTFPQASKPLGTYPDQVFVYNYDMQTWSFYDDTFTTFGYFYPFNDVTWADLVKPWAEYKGFTWVSGSLQKKYENVVAGNQQGFVHILEQSIQNDISLNISALSVASPGVFTVVDHNLTEGTWIKLSGIGGTTQADGVSLNGRNFRIKLVIDANNFTLEEFDSINVGNAPVAPATFSFILSTLFIPIIPKSVQINVGAVTFRDTNGDGVLHGTPITNTGAVNYQSGAITLNFSPALGAPTAVIVRVVANQGFDPVNTTGVYTGGGYVTKISNFLIQSKIFNFFKQAQKSRISKVDFYVQSTQDGEFTCDILGDGNTSLPINTPLQDNPRSNVVLTSENVTQIPDGEETIFRLYCDAVSQTTQLQFRLSDQQMAVDSINDENIEINAFIVHSRPAGRLY